MRPRPAPDHCDVAFCAARNRHCAKKANRRRTACPGGRRRQSNPERLEIEMEREQELKKLINVLRHIARLATRAQEMSAGASEARYGISIFNKILARLGELDPNVKTVFEPLAEDSSLLSVAMACRQVVSYYEDEVKAEENLRVGWKVEEELGAGWFATDFGKKGFL